jgi:hypothetical protein
MFPRGCEYVGRDRETTEGEREQSYGRHWMSFRSLA